MSRPPNYSRRDGSETFTGVRYETQLERSENNVRERSNPHNCFGAAAQAAGVSVSGREIRFPERRVLLARVFVAELMQVENLFHMLAELRLAKRPAGGLWRGVSIHRCQQQARNDGIAD
jgi:hypothetical protein